ncbi:SAV_2336 N-terminal domain-related protein [Kitasatospora sp. NPDC002040]|uniref:SAV_2336 N-terminal domain-related protein n=1 Tax=Kitasatospora sp. NPDC002040 TaxID=3154661 RepID=UPI00331B492C
MTGPTPVARLHQILSAAGVALTPEQLADVLWLAGRLPARAGSEPAGVQAESEALPPPRTPAAPAPLPSYGSAHPTPQGTDLYAAAGPAVAGTAALPVLVRSQRALPAARSFTRALRPLRRHRPTPGGAEIDESATADLVAETGLFDLVLRPATERWLDVSLVVDDGPSMDLWRELSSELEELLSRSGVFRRVRSYGLDTRHPDGPRLHDRPFGAGQAALAPRSVCPADGRGVVLVLSDAVGAGWRNGRMDPLLARWARSCGTAVLQPLPQRMWPGTGLRAESMLVRAGRAGAANSGWQVAHPLLPPELAPFDGLPLPVLEFSPAAVSSWAGLVARGGEATLPVAQLTGEGVAPAPSPAAVVGDMRSRLLHFRAAASPEAYRLAGHLAGVRPLTLPVMRLVQRAVLGGRRSPAELAEVLLGGLLRRAPAPEAGHTVRYDFRPGLRELLLESLPAREVLGTAALVTRLLHGGDGGGGRQLPALRSDTAGSAALPPGANAFAGADTPLLQHFGPAGGPPGGGEPADDAPLEELPFGRLAELDPTLAALVRGERWQGAVELGELVLERLLTELGPDHPTVLGGRFDLAEWIGQGGAPQTALRLCRELLADLTGRLGTERGRLMVLRAKVAHWTGRSDDWAAAVAAYRELLPDQEGLLGPEHPDCLVTRHQIAFWTGAGSGDPEATLELYLDLLPRQERFLGPQHPETFRTRANIASWTGQSGQVAESLQLWQALLPELREVLEPEDLLIVITEAEIGHWSAVAGDPESALRLIPAVVPRLTEAFGAHHASAYLHRRRIAHWTGVQGDTVGALGLLRELLADVGRALPPENPAFLGVRAEYAFWTVRTGDRTAGLQLLRDLLPELDAILGPDHQDTRWVRETAEQLDAAEVVEGEAGA